MSSSPTSPATAPASASPSPLTAGGSAFSVTYSTVRIASPVNAARGGPVRDGRRIHPGR